MSDNYILFTDSGADIPPPCFPNGASATSR